MKPAKPITDPTFRYTPSVQTDLRKTFARVRREAKQHAEAEAATKAEAEHKVRQLKRGSNT